MDANKPTTTETLTSAGAAAVKAAQAEAAARDGAKARCAAFFAKHPELAAKPSKPSTPMASRAVGQWDGVGEEIDEG